MHDDVTKQEFLKALSELCNEYEVVIGGCGCCGSPFVYGDIDGDLKWDEDKKIFTLE